MNYEENKKIFGMIVKQARIRKNMTQLELAKRVGYTSDSSSTTIAKIESGVNDIPLAKLQKFAEVLDLDPLALIIPDGANIFSNEYHVPYNSLPILDHAKNTIPLIGQIACGSPILAEDNIVEMLPPLPGVNADMALLCKGDSMVDAGIFDGDVAYIHLQPFVENGTIAAVRIGDEATLKRFNFDGVKMILKPENKKYPEQIYQGAKLTDVTILGKLVGVVRRFH